MARHRTQTATVVVSALVAAIIGAGSAALANHQFPDVGTGTFFHDAIGAGFDAGCYTGYNDGTFRSADNPTRGQFAYWLNNCSPRSTSGFGTYVGGEGAGVELVAPAPIEVGAADGKGALATVTLHANGFTGDCDACESAVSLTVDVGEGPVPIRATYLETFLANTAGPFSDSDDSGSVGATFEVWGTPSFGAIVTIDDPNDTGTMVLEGTVTIVLTPLDGAGQGVGPPPPPPEAEAAGSLSGPNGAVVPLGPIPPPKG